MARIHGVRTALRQIIKDPNAQRSDRMIQPLLFASQGIRFRKLEVILTTNIERLGKAGETVKVAPGFFRNHLMPKLLAVPNIEKFAYLIREQRKMYQPEEVEEEVKVVKKTVEDKSKEYEKAARRLDSAKLVLRRLIDVHKFKTRESKLDPIVLRAPVTKEELAAEVARQLCVRIQPDNLELPNPLSAFGEYEVPLRLPNSIPIPEGKLQWTLKVKIRGK